MKLKKSCRIWKSIVTHKILIKLVQGRKTLSLILSIGLLLIMNSCRNATIGDPIQPEQDEYWDVFRIKNQSNIILNFDVVEDFLFIVTNEAIIKFDEFTLNSNLSTSSISVNDLSIKPLISKNLTIWLDKENNSINLSKNTELGITNIKPKIFGKQFEDYNFVQFQHSNDFGLFIDNNRVIALITKKDESIGFGGEMNYLVYFNAQQNGAGKIEISNIGYWDLPSMQNIYITPFKMIYFDNVIYFSFKDANSGDHWYISITDNGVINEHFLEPFCGSAIIHFFEYQGNLFANLSDWKLISTLDGNDWLSRGEMSPLYNDYKEIDDYLFFYYKSEIYCWIIDSNSMRIYKLPVSNMKGNTITSINKFKDYLVVATHNGIFYKKINEVIEDRLLLYEFN